MELKINPFIHPYIHPYIIKLSHTDAIKIQCEGVTDSKEFIYLSVLKIKNIYGLKNSITEMHLPPISTFKEYKMLQFYKTLITLFGLSTLFQLAEWF